MIYFKLRKKKSKCFILKWHFGVYLKPLWFQYGWIFYLFLSYIYTHENAGEKWVKMLIVYFY